MNAKSLLKNAFLKSFIIYNKRWGLKQKLNPSSIQTNKLIAELPEKKEKYTSTG